MAKTTKKSTKQSKDEQEDKNGAIFVPAGALIGVGMGFVFDNIVAGALIGVGCGFLIFAAITAFRK